MIHLSSRDLIKRITNFRVASHHLKLLIPFLVVCRHFCRFFSRRGRYGNGFELIESLARKGCSEREWKSLTPCLNVSFFSKRIFDFLKQKKCSVEGNEMESNYGTSKKGENDTVDDGIAFNLSCRLTAWFWRVDAKGFVEMNEISTSFRIPSTKYASSWLVNWEI